MAGSKDGSKDKLLMEPLVGWRWVEMETDGAASRICIPPMLAGTSLKLRREVEGEELYGSWTGEFCSLGGDL
jgi:hypothetical protein